MLDVESELLKILVMLYLCYIILFCVIFYATATL